ncbi:MAG TPA: 23S rRNA (uracil(1939)-C(5))-methyltransferase RlmD [Flavobacteriales bacterium]|nr:23S rRNA (uracil(1939)-C(5))-methyltransferase RlmD [Flavobacteriales bacterium]
MGRSRNKITLIEKVEVIDISSDGRGVGRHEDVVLFIEDAIPGDVVDVEIKRKRRKYREGRIVKHHTKSKLRVEPACEHFGVCGGCSWQHMNYEDQLVFKQQTVANNLKKIGNITPNNVLPIVPADEIYMYRNKLEYTFSNSRWLTAEEIKSGGEIADNERNALGFHVPGRFDKVLHIENCHLQRDPSNAIRLATKAYVDENKLAFFDIRKQKGFLRNMIIRTTSTGEVMVVISFYRDYKTGIFGLLEHLKEQFDEITSLMYVINSKKNDTITDLEVVSHIGPEHITEKIGKLKFRIGPKTFFQTNTIQAENLFQTVLDFGQFTGKELVYDLYTGSGSIANFIAPSVKEVVGLEYVPESIEDAVANSKLNKIKNASYFAGDIKDLLNKDFVKKNGVPDVIITDPPRPGMHKDVITRMLEIAPAKIIYVSCNSATQARDLALLSGKYTVEKSQAVDMFPHTTHIENVTLLLRK